MKSKKTLREAISLFFKNVCSMFSRGFQLIHLCETYYFRINDVWDKENTLFCNSHKHQNALSFKDVNRYYITLFTPS